MLRVELFFQGIFSRFRRRKFRPVASLDAAVLQQAVAEARMLKERYAVDVQPLAPGEKPDIPRQAGE